MAKKLEKLLTKTEKLILLEKMLHRYFLRINDYFNQIDNIKKIRKGDEISITIKTKIK